jgi:hypothetical protein
MKPTESQLQALRLAAAEPIRYYKGGWYSVPAIMVDQQHPAVGGACVTRHTVNACVTRGWLEVEGGEIYACRWRLTDAGRVVLAEAGK